VAPEQRIRAGYGVARANCEVAAQSPEAVWSLGAERERANASPLLAMASPVSHRPAWLPKH